MTAKRNGKRIAALTAAVLSAIALTFVLMTGCGTVRQYEYTVEVLTADTVQTDEALVDVIARIRPSVVDVYASTLGSSSAGSGVIMGGADTDGDNDYDQYYIITNHHVIDGCSGFSVDLLFIDDDGNETHDSYAATLIGGAPTRDIAVLRIDRKADETISCATFADSDAVRVGSEVIAIGNPLGILGGTVTKGIISATAREVTVGDIGKMTLLQTDTTINSGNSGGGLFNTAGQIVGIVNSGYESYNGQNVEGLNFAIPANDALYAANALIDTFEETDGSVSQYGYVAGDTEIGFAYASSSETKYSIIYDNSQLKSYSAYVLAQANSYGELYDNWGTSIRVITGISRNGTFVAVNTMNDLENALQNVKAGDTVDITSKPMLSVSQGSGFMSRTYYYVGDEETTVTVTAAQYIYTPPTV